MQNTLQPSSLAAKAPQQLLSKGHAINSPRFTSPQIPAPSKPETSQKEPCQQSKESGPAIEDEHNRRLAGSQQKEEEVFDPIDTDIEGFCGIRHMHQAKRLRLNQTSRESSQLEGQHAAEQYLAKKRAEREKVQRETEKRDDKEISQEDGERPKVLYPMTSESASSTHVSSNNSTAQATLSVLAAEVCF